MNCRRAHTPYGLAECDTSVAVTIIERLAAVEVSRQPSR